MLIVHSFTSQIHNLFHPKFFPSAVFVNPRSISNSILGPSKILRKSFEVPFQKSWFYFLRSHLFFFLVSPRSRSLYSILHPFETLFSSFRDWIIAKFDIGTNPDFGYRAKSSNRTRMISLTPTRAYYIALNLSKPQWSLLCFIMGFEASIKYWALMWLYNSYSSYSNFSIWLRKTTALQQKLFLS